MIFEICSVFVLVAIWTTSSWLLAALITYLIPHFPVLIKSFSYKRVFLSVCFRFRWSILVFVLLLIDPKYYSLKIFLSIALMLSLTLLPSGELPNALLPIAPLTTALPSTTRLSIALPPSFRFSSPYLTLPRFTSLHNSFMFHHILRNGLVFFSCCGLFLCRLLVRIGWKVPFGTQIKYNFAWLDVIWLIWLRLVFFSRTSIHLSRPLTNNLPKLKW